jgi:hypothetical protein
MATTIYTLRYNRTTNHIDGILHTAGSQMDYPRSACPAISRTGLRMGAGAITDDIQVALGNARITGGRKICKTCEKNATALIEALPAPAPAPAPAEEADPLEGVSKGFRKARRFALDLVDAGSQDADFHLIDDRRVAIGTLHGSLFSIEFDASGFVYGPSTVKHGDRKPVKVRNVREALRIMDEIARKALA